MIRLHRAARLAVPNGTTLLSRSKWIGQQKLTMGSKCLLSGGLQRSLKLGSGKPPVRLTPSEAKGRLVALPALWSEPPSVGGPAFGVHSHFLGASHFAAVRVYSSQRPNPPRSRIASGLGMIGAGGMLLLGKGKYLLGALKLTKFASLGSMLLTVGTYSVFFGLPYAAGMTSLILIHESGHALVMKKLGIPFSPMVFVPFMGAAVAMKQRPRDAYEEALVAFGGPVLGSAGALGCAVAAHGTDSPLLFALADFGFMINLFNMMPLGMMDGGRICGAISPYAGVAGLGLGGAMAYQGMIHNPIFYLILLGGGYETFMRFYDPMGHAPPNYYRITAGQRAAITGGYFGLVGALFAAMAWNRQYMMTPEQLRRQSLETTHYRRYE